MTSSSMRIPMAGISMGVMAGRTMAGRTMAGIGIGMGRRMGGVRCRCVGNSIVSRSRVVIAMGVAMRIGRMRGGRVRVNRGVGR